MTRDYLMILAAIVGTFGIAGCGGQQSPQTGADTASADTASATDSTTPPPASIGQSDKPAAEVDPDAPELLIAEITRLRTLPDAIIQVSYENGGTPTEVERAPTEAEIAAERERRQHKILELAASAIEKTHNNPEREQTFNNAVHYLCEARVQLALAGDTEQAQILSADAETLYQNAPESFATVETGKEVVRLAELMAAKYGAQQPAWVTAYANQARLFADRFPDEQGRAATSLIAAGRKCEQFGLHEQARQCYLLVERLYPDSPYVQHIAGVLRRLRLVGQPLELGGPTIDGGFLKADDFAGRPLLIIFWASNSEKLARDLPLLKQLTDHYPDEKLTVIGVNLDENEAAVDAFLEESGIGWRGWRQIFFSQADQRGSGNPIARYYGVQTVPTYWLVDAQGTVVAAPAEVEQLPSQVAELQAGVESPSGQ